MPNPSMQYSQDGLALTKSFEGCRLTSYQDEAGIWTIGWGHTGSEITGPGIIWTQAQADAQLIADTTDAVEAVNILVTAPLLQCQFDAVVDFTFNAGIGSLRESTLRYLLNVGGRLEEAAEQFRRWIFVTINGQKVVSLGLKRRRAAEEAMFRGQSIVDVDARETL